MSLNTCHWGSPTHGGVLIHADEYILLFYSKAHLSFIRPEMMLRPSLIAKPEKSGRLYLTTHRILYVTNTPGDLLQSMSIPFISLSEIETRQPCWGGQVMTMQVKPQPGGGWRGLMTIKVTMRDTNVDEFCESVLQVKYLARRRSSIEENDETWPTWQMPPEAPIPLLDEAVKREVNCSPADPKHYLTLPVDYIGWEAPIDSFPNRPARGSVFCMADPAPYPGARAAGVEKMVPRPPEEKSKLSPKGSRVRASMSKIKKSLAKVTFSSEKVRSPTTSPRASPRASPSASPRGSQSGLPPLSPSSAGSRRSTTSASSRHSACLESN